MADKSLLQLPLATTGAGALLYGVQDNQDKAFPASVLQGSEQPVAANLVYAGPPQAPGNYPTFRPLVVGDIPDLGSIYLKSNGGSIVNATINNSNIVGGTISGATGIFDDNKFTIRNPVDTTKQIRFSAANISAGAVRVFDFPDLSGSVVTTNADQTITNKSLTVKPSASAGATLRIPHGQPPSAPVNGDVWTTNAGMYVQANNATIGPLAAAASSTVTTFNGRQGAVSLTSGDVTSAIGYIPYNPGNDAYMKKTGDTATGPLSVSGAALRAYNWGNVASNGVLQLGDENSYIFKSGSSFIFNNNAGAFTATLNSGGTIFTTNNLNPDLKVNKAGDTMTGTLIMNNSAVRVSGWSGVATDGVVYFGSGDTYIYKQGASYQFNTGTFNAVLNAGGTIYTTSNFNPAAYVQKSGDTMTGDLRGPSALFSNIVRGAALQAYGGTFGTQSGLLARGYNNNITRWFDVLESDGSFALYSYDTNGGNGREFFNFKTTVAGGTNVANFSVPVVSTGSQASFSFTDRSDSRFKYEWYMNGGTAYLWTSYPAGGTGNKLAVSPSGDINNTGFIRAGGLSSGVGGVALNIAEAGKSGFVSFYHSEGVRVGYIGYASGGTINCVAEAGYSQWAFTGYITATGGFGPGSDPRLKDEKSLKSVDNAIDKVYNLNVRSGKYHNWYNPDGKERLFVMADQSMAENAPEVFQKDAVDKDGQKYNGWSADQMIALLTKAVQELTDEVRTLKEKMNE